MSLARNRRAAELWGRRAEFLCCWWLRLKFYRVVARGYRVPVGEVDILARRGNVLAIIEVKARRDLADAAFAVTPGKQRRVARAATQFLASRPDLARCQPRFDVMLAKPWRLPHHIKDAWRLG